MGFPACLGKALDALGRSAGPERRHGPRRPASAGARAARLAETFIADAVGLVGVFALAPSQVLGIVGVVALEVDHFAVALEREDVCRDAVEEPPIVRDHDRAAGEAQERILERA